MSSQAQPEQPVRAVGGVVYRQRAEDQFEVLLIKKRGGFWTLPKGHVEPQEDERAAVLREIQEETGIRGDVGDAICEVQYTIIKKGKPRTKQVTYYLMQATGGKLSASKKEQIQKLRWFSFPAALRRIKRGRVRKIAARGGSLLAAHGEVSTGDVAL